MTNVHKRINFMARIRVNEVWLSSKEEIKEWVTKSY